MGWCHEFGPQIKEGCDHPMVAGESACSCPECGVVCHGRFGGCVDVWARGPRAVVLVRSQPVPRARQEAAPVEPVAGDLVVAEPLAPENGRWVLDWLRGALDSMRDELHVVTGAMARQQALMMELLEQTSAPARVIELAETLPGRMGDAIAAVIDARDAAYQTRVQDVEGLRDELTVSAVEIQECAIALREESVRLRALRESIRADLPTVADAISEALERADSRMAEAHEKLEALTRNGDSAPVE